MRAYAHSSRFGITTSHDKRIHSLYPPGRLLESLDSVYKQPFPQIQAHIDMDIEGFEHLLRAPRFSLPCAVFIWLI